MMQAATAQRSMSSEELLTEKHIRMEGVYMTTQEVRRGRPFQLSSEEVYFFLL
jgi:hypothetical protein